MENIVWIWAKLITPTQGLMVVLVAIATLIILDFIFKNFFCHMKLKATPHPFPLWPMLGNLPLIGKFPHLSFYKLSQKYGDVMELKLGSISVIMISSPNHAKEVLQIHDLLFVTLVENPPFLTKSFQLHDICNCVSIGFFKF